MKLEFTNIVFFEKISSVLDAQQPFVAYRKPNSKVISAIHQNNNDLIKLEDYNSSGFIFAPFNKNETKILFPISKSEQFFTQITNNLEIVDSSLKLEDSCTIEEKEKYILKVNKAVDFIKNGFSEKVVLSRKETIAIGKSTITTVFKRMLNSYKNAFVYLWYHPKVGLWMGATPEQLIAIKNNKLQTMSLAGTQKFSGTLDVIWEKKELEEQQFVTDFIVENIKDKINKLEVTGPITSRAGSLIHLRSDICGELKSKKSLEQLINALHPTPAICGIPKNAATEFIMQNEEYDREFYSGFMGEINCNNASAIYVNLRCMKIENHNATIYIGGGLTKDSQPVKEWEETVAKAAIMKSMW
ncbi:chorismate-binding protein [uncultured Lutibacter sp.]|uniref:chorismate-binding protein n=1 Tax=uncultured Lutibacter sp. TaxID=437739 RepID=UPI002607F868|nr:chorismate-binding protein [uncultured Lutibacter sp.]